MPVEVREEDEVMNGVSVLESVSVELVARIISKHLALTSDRIGRQTLITRVIEIQSQVAG